MPNLIFIDESSPESPNYSQISGFVISIENYVLLRSEIIRDHISSKAINNQNQSFEPCDIPCYKWSEFLKKDAVNDECKYRKLDYLLSVLYTS
jgi:hypothetical protein